MLLVFHLEGSWGTFSFLFRWEEDRFGCRRRGLTPRHSSRSDDHVVLKLGCGNRTRVNRFERLVLFHSARRPDVVLHFLHFTECSGNKEWWTGTSGPVKSLKKMILVSKSMYRSSLLPGWKEPTDTQRCRCVSVPSVTNCVTRDSVGPGDTGRGRL